MRQYIDSDDLAGEVRMARSLDARTVLIVEGATDAGFFERFADLEHCYVLAAHDRTRAIAVLRVLNAAQFFGVLAIVDADFGRITGTAETEPNLLFCDGHDLEMMLIRSQALERVVAEHSSEKKLSAFLASRQRQVVLATSLAQACLPLGAMLLISLQQDLGLTFEDLNFNDFVEHGSLDINHTKLIRSVLNKSSCHDSQLEARILQQVSALVKHATEIWDLARGHDCVEVLAFALRSTIGTKKSKTSTRKPISVNADALERELRLAFSEADFAVTLLYKEINAWETTNLDYRVILRP
jgi:Protein of unknown function (DUF4435)